MNTKQQDVAPIKVVLYDMNDTLVLEKGRKDYFRRENKYWIEEENGENVVATQLYVKEVKKAVLAGGITLQIIPGRYEELKKNKNKQIENWIYSSNKEELIWFVLEKLGIKDMVSGVFSTIDLGNSTQKNEMLFLSIFENLLSKKRQLIDYYEDDLLAIENAKLATKLIAERHRLDIRIHKMEIFDW